MQCCVRVYCNNKSRVGRDDADGQSGQAAAGRQLNSLRSTGYSLAEAAVESRDALQKPGWVGQWGH